MTLKITEVEVKDNLLTFEMRVLRGLYYPTPTKRYTIFFEKRFYINKKKEPNPVYVRIKKIPNTESSLEQ